MQKFTLETTVGIFVVVGLLAVGYMTVNLGHFSILGDDSYSLFAPFTSVSGLRPGSPVNMMGIEVGRVERITLDQKDQKAIVEIRMRKGVRVYRDSIASIKTEGLIGDKFISIDAGGSESVLKPGGSILDTQAPTDLMELISKYAFGDVKK